MSGMFFTGHSALCMQITMHRWHQKLRHCLFVDY